MDESWRQLRVGDRIRIIRMPYDAVTPGYAFLPETRRLYKKLIARGRSVRIFQIDEYGHPWIRCRFQKRNGSWEHHWLAVNDDSWERVRNRQIRR
jgi:hypothetical protein